MKTSSFDIYRKETNNQNKKIIQKTPKAQQKEIENPALKGFLMNNFIKKEKCENFDNFDRISSSLLIPEQIKEENIQTQKEKESSFDYKKALKPLSILAIAGVGTISLLSFSMKNYSKVMAKSDNFVHPGDLARNINIVEEPHFAMYRALRDPNSKNIFGLIGVGIMSGITLVAKNLTDGIKEVWIKKQNCDIAHNLQENLISVEAQAFSGKLNVVNSLLKDSTNYFKAVLSNGQTNNISFKNYINFKGTNKPEENKKENKVKSIALISLSVLGFVGLSYGLFRNYQKTAKNLDTFVQKYEDNQIRNKIQEAIQEGSEKGKNKLINLFKIINAKDNTMKENFSKLGLEDNEIEKLIKEIKQEQIYAQAPEALGGISEKIQYYCYINEDRGHLYNWLLNPENKFNKYLFLSFSALSSIGYIAKNVAQAIKEVTVEKENSKSELNLRKRLISVEIENFKAKKLSAINPLLENFEHQLKSGKSKEELKELAENILIEIKNGPPFVYG